MTTEGEYEVLAQPLGGADGPVALLLRSRTEALRPVRTMRTVLLLALALAVTVSVFLSYAVARTVTRPLAALTDGMKAVAETGDLTKKIGTGGRWDDEDARLVARTFDALTDSIARFQRDAALRERLSALGRLSTVVAHEVRNPLMIIKGALRTLQRGAASGEEVREVASEIDQEVGRLDRIVGEVLDFARPLKVELGPVHLAEVCREAIRGVPEAELDIEEGLGPVETDRERLRAVLANLVQNALDSLAERGATRGSPAAVKPAASGPAGAQGGATEGAAAGSSTAEAEVALQRDRAESTGIMVGVRQRPHGVILLFVQDLGAGIAEGDIPQVFEPYFTTKRKGTGLGLAIARKTIESLGGTIRIESRGRQGTRVEIELPGRRGAQPWT
jgi:signal transduction histidine kinase